MNPATSIAERLRQLMEEQGVGENELARRSKVPQPTIHRILKGVSKSPRISNLESIAASLGTTASFLAHGDAKQASSTPAGSGASGTFPVIGAAAAALAGGARYDKEPTAQHLRSYPILTWPEAMQASQLKEPASDEKRQFESSDYLQVGVAFWLRMRGDAMAAPIGSSPSLPEGTLVLMDTGLEAAPGKLVLAAPAGSAEPTLRTLIDESGQIFLKPLNPSYPLIKLEKSCRVLAVAIEAKIKL
ncbi:SOS-response transcriptional repressor LexA (RecA-mediated autopeptidase) [Franzmannia pantelleriensis]|uniref:SOS-response transcriptional repressor LexA (RecA-mediated autopeptidase) n=1 Tax=Franzmannia pantelleriensis TaxID=48727 RepID=A0A1G9R945_9GAMM|nr:XRE family transcriptional regulator [Halomonas pantelleriensis]SDM19822.1 SOS-response transcriptional repressor LexA (RecA-mediated autopeptidase) [Halomonas pantelleriensis]